MQKRVNNYLVGFVSLAIIFAATIAEANPPVSAPPVQSRTKLYSLSLAETIDGTMFHAHTATSLLRQEKGKFSLTVKSPDSPTFNIWNVSSGSSGNNFWKGDYDGRGFQYFGDWDTGTNGKLRVSYFKGDGDFKTPSYPDAVEYNSAKPEAYRDLKIEKIIPNIKGDKYLAYGVITTGDEMKPWFGVVDPATNSYTTVYTDNNYKFSFKDAEKDLQAGKGITNYRVHAFVEPTPGRYVIIYYYIPNVITFGVNQQPLPFTRIDTATGARTVIPNITTNFIGAPLILSENGKYILYGQYSPNTAPSNWQYFRYDIYDAVTGQVLHSPYRTPIGNMIPENMQLAQQGQNGPFRGLKQADGSFLFVDTAYPIISPDFSQLSCNKLFYDGPYPNILNRVEPCIIDVKTGAVSMPLRNTALAGYDFTETFSATGKSLQFIDAKNRQFYNLSWNDKGLTTLDKRMFNHLLVRYDPSTRNITEFKLPERFNNNIDNNPGNRGFLGLALEAEGTINNSVYEMNIVHSGSDCSDPKDATKCVLKMPDIGNMPVETYNYTGSNTTYQWAYFNISEFNFGRCGDWVTTGISGLGSDSQSRMEYVSIDPENNNCPGVSEARSTPPATPPAAPPATPPAAPPATSGGSGATSGAGTTGGTGNTGGTGMTGTGTTGTGTTGNSGGATSLPGTTGNAGGTGATGLPETTALPPVQPTRGEGLKNFIRKRN